ncbi:MAG TPA: hypothetical protein VJ821_19600, partial [Anaerolineales bacterium]|nr:hypothetical protein [Anaerolineales bacterium]
MPSRPQEWFVEFPDRASPTVVQSTAAVQSTAPGFQIDLAVAEFPARLAVVKASARVFKPGSFETNVGQAQSFDIQVDDGIEVVGVDVQGVQSHSILQFSDFLNVELFGNTKVFVADVKPGQGGSTDVTLDLDSGHMFVHLNEQTNTRVIVQTPYSTLKTLTAGAEFDICRNEALTCVVVKRGVVEITAQGKKEIIRGGSAAYVLQNQPPSTPICVPAQGFIAWEERFRQFAGGPALQEEIAELPQRPCPVTTLGLPLDAHILYQDNFRGASSGWQQGKLGHFTARYVERRYYEVQVQGTEDRYLAFLPDERRYQDVNVDVKVFTEAAGGGDFRYGVVLRRSGEQYYAFVISPSTESWYFLKNSADGLEILEAGIDRRIRGLEAQDTLRVESYGSTFLVFLNGRYFAWVNDSDYASGEVGLFVDTRDNPDAQIRFNSIIVWDLAPELLIPVTGRGENCFNTFDDDGDGWIDRADPNCQKPEISLILTASPLPTATLVPSTSTARPTITRTPRPTNTRRPTVTSTARPTNTRRPTITPSPRPTNTRRPTLTSTQRPTSTRRPTLTPTPRSTSTQRPTLTSMPQPTDTRRPTPTPMPQPTDTPRPAPTPTPRPTNPPPPTNTEQPQPTDT